MNKALRFKGRFDVRIFDKNGRLKYVLTARNGVVNDGKDKILGVMFNAVTRRFRIAAASRSTAAATSSRHSEFLGSVRSTYLVISPHLLLVSHPSRSLQWPAIPCCSRYTPVPNRRVYKSCRGAHTTDTLTDSRVLLGELANAGLPPLISGNMVRESFANQFKIHWVRLGD